MRFALLGHPVGHSMSPALHEAAFRALELEHTYELIDVPSEADLPPVLDAIRRGEIGGANVTVPYKRAVLGLVDDVSPSARVVGAANVIVRTEGSRIVAFNTDADALAADLEIALGHRPRARAAVLGAGGAGLAAVVACEKLGFAEIAVTTRSWSSSSALLHSPYMASMSSLGAQLAFYPSDGAAITPGPLDPPSEAAPIVDWLAWIEGADLLVQASSAGMSGDPVSSEEALTSAVPSRRLKRSVLVYDVVYNPPVTALMREVRASGRRATGGLGMLIRQAALSFTLWTRLPAPLEVMRAAARDP